jgi:TPR repeat protein
MIWLKREGLILAKHETESLSKNVTTASVSGTGGAWSDEDWEARTSALQRVRNEATEIQSGQALPLAAQPANKRKVQARWIWYHRHRAKVALSVVEVSNANDKTENGSSGRKPTQAESEQAERLLDRGQQFATQGNLVIAREYFARAAALGLPVAALRLAETHDPHELKHFKIHGLKPNLGEAKRWYERAIELGVPGAEAKLRRLSSR